MRRPFLSLPRHPGKTVVFRFTDAGRNPQFPVVVLFSMGSGPGSKGASRGLSSVRPTTRLLPRQDAFLLQRQRFYTRRGNVRPSLISLLPKSNRHLIPPRRPRRVQPTRRGRTPSLHNLQFGFRVVNPTRTNPVKRLRSLFNTGLPRYRQLPSPLYILFCYVQRDNT